MKVVPITKNALVLNSYDWRRLCSLMKDFKEVCDSQSCKTCPLENFCSKYYLNPADYLKNLYDCLEVYPKEKE